MALNLQNFITPQTDWAGLYKLGDTLERRNQRDEQRNLQREGRKHASAQFLQNYLDPKDYMSGTAYDPMVVKGLDDAMQQGMALAAKGVDTPTMMMALGPMVKKLSDYSSRAKTLNTTIDDQIKKMQQSDLNGYDYAALKREAMQSAMFDTDPQTGKATLNPDKADPGMDWISQTIAEKPELVTTNAALDEFAKKSPMQKTLSDITQYSPTGEMDRRKVHMIGQNWLVPEVDKKGATTGLVPKYEEAIDDGKPLTHPFKGKDGKVTQATVRLLDEEIFNNLPAPAINRIKALTKEKIKDYKLGGESIDLNHPKAKLVGRAIAYDVLNQRKSSTIESAGIIDKPSAAQSTLNVQDSEKYFKMVEERAAATARGRESVETDADRAKKDKKNTGQAIGEVFKNNPDFISGESTELSGKASEYGGGAATDLGKIKAIDVTASFPTGAIKINKAEGYKYEKVYYDPKGRRLILDRATGEGMKKKTSKEVVPESKVGQFIANIAESNGIPRASVRQLLDEIGYKGQKFSGVNEDEIFRRDLQERKKKDSISKNILQTFPLKKK